jgi:hypothetical protein
MVLIAFALLSQNPSAEAISVRDRYWEQMARAKKLYAKVIYPALKGGIRERIVEYRLEKPNRIHTVERAEAFTGTVKWQRDEAGGPFHLYYGENQSLLSMFEPFFGRRRFDIATLDTHPYPSRAQGPEGVKRVSVVELRSDSPEWQHFHFRVLVNAKSALPWADYSGGNASSYLTRCEEIRLSAR